MSSLRISHQSRAIAAPAGGDGSRSEHADDGVSFSVALGAAARVAPRGAAAFLDGKAGGATGDAAEPRKRTDAKAKSADAATAAGVAASLVAAPALVGPAVAVGGAGGVSADGASDPSVTAAAVGNGDPTIGGKGAAHDWHGTLPIAPAGAPAAAALPAAGEPGPATAPQGDRVAERTQQGTRALLGGASAAPSISSAAAAPASPPVTATSGAGATPPVQGQSPVPDPGSLVALVPVPQGAAPLRQPAPAAIAALRSLGAPASSSDPAVNAPADPTGASSPALTAPTGQSPSDAHVPANATAAAPPVLPPPAGQAVAAGASGYAAAIRDRFAPSSTASDASGVAAATATGAGGAQALAAPPSSAAASAPAGPSGEVGAIGDQVAGQLARMVSTGPREMVMRLRPPELGDLTVRVAVSGRDVSAWFASPQPQVQNAISAALGQLQTSLGNAGYNLNGAWVGADASGGRSRQNPSPLPAAPASLATPAALPVAAAAPRPALSGLNIYV